MNTRLPLSTWQPIPRCLAPIANGLSKNGLIHDQMRIVLEKPVGHDYESASSINDEVGMCFRESQVFRIDHYLGKETVQNLLALRFGNSLFEPLWRREVIDHVQITVAKTSVWKVVLISMIGRAPCAIWCKIILCSWFAW